MVQYLIKNLKSMKRRTRYLALMLLSFLLYGGPLFAQQEVIVTGKVLSESGDEMANTTITIENVQTGQKDYLISDSTGVFRIAGLVAGQRYNLYFDHVGFASYSLTNLTFSATENNTLLIRLKPGSASTLGEVVVTTALGIRRQERTLSYNAQQVNADDFTKVKDANFVNSLNGKVAGVTINQSSSGMGGATKVVMRGTKSIEKSSNALYVIDGVPLLSLTGSQGEGRFSSSGSTEGIADLNPEDIESMTVLTGASAAALYGSSAANGAILITTKKGKTGKVNVMFSSNAESGKPFIMPQFQNRYGNDGKVTSWGAKLPEDAEKYDPKDFFNTAYSVMNTLALSGGTGKNQTYFSAASTNARGIVPNNLYNRYNFTFRNTTFLLNDRFKIDASASYILQDNRNMINQGEYMNPLVSAYLLPRGDGLEKTKIFEIYNPSRKIYEQLWGDFKDQDGLFNGSYSGDYSMQNPYWIAYRNVRDMNRERNMLSLSLSYDLKSWSASEKWDIGVRGRTDNVHYKGTDKRYASTLALLDMSKNGHFGLSEGAEKQNYFDILTNLRRNFSLNNLGGLSLTANLGASLQDSRTDGSFIHGPLRSNGIPNVFNTFNIDQDAKKTLAGQAGWIEQVQSVFGSMEVGYNNYLFLTITGRNEWPSQLTNSPKASFFYPSVGLSSVITDMLSPDTKAKVTPILSFLKARVAFSSVASPFERWLTMPTYSFDADNKVWKSVSYFPIGTLFPERTNSYEGGFSSKWFRRKVSLDFTVYRTNTYNQTIRADISPSTGYDAVFFQTGNVQNTGFELGLGYNLLTQGDFKWNTYFTAGYNKNTIKSLLENYVNPVTNQVESQDYLVKNSFGPLKFILKTGGSMGDIYTDADFRRNQDGKIYLDANGNVSVENFADGEFKKIGSVLPDYNLGWKNDISYKNFNLGGTITGRLGGLVVSMTEAAMDHYGVSKGSADDRDAGGVLINGFRVNSQNYYDVRGKDRLPQYYTYSADNFRLQEAYLSYRIPKKVLNNFADVTIGLTGRNLFMIYNKAPFDPETISSTGNYVQGLDYFMLPSLRSFGINLKANF